jgi:hypothetical protein
MRAREAVVWLDGEGDAAIRGDDRRCSLYCPPTTPLHLHQPHSTTHCPSACARVCTDVIGFDRRNSPPVRSDAPVAIVPHSLWHDQQTATSRDDRGDEPQLLQLIRLAKCSEFTLSRTRTLNGSCVARSITHTHTHTHTNLCLGKMRWRARTAATCWTGRRRGREWYFGHRRGAGQASAASLRLCCSHVTVSRARVRAQFRNCRSHLA